MPHYREEITCKLSLGKSMYKAQYFQVSWKWLEFDKTVSCRLLLLPSLQILC